MMGSTAPILSVVTPALNEAGNVALFHRRLAAALGGVDERGLAWEWIVVDDGSRDGTSQAVAQVAEGDRRVRGVRLERSVGSHAAILRGLAESRGATVFVLAADLQDPPELVAELLAHWRQGARIVWAVRRQRDGEGRLAVAWSHLYHALVRRAGGARGLPAGGTGCCLLDREVVAAICRSAPPPVDVFAAAGRLRVPAAEVPYDRSPRSYGRSGWSVGKKVRFALRSLLAGRAGGGEPRPY